MLSTYYPPFCALWEAVHIHIRSCMRDTPVVVPSVHPSSDAGPFWPAPSHFMQQPVPQPKTHPSLAPNVADAAFPENNALIPGLGSIAGNVQQQWLERHLQRKDVGGRGSAIAPARRRLHSSRAMRQNISTVFDAATDQHEESDQCPTLSSAHQKTAVKGQDTPNTIWRRMKVVRSALK